MHFVHGIISFADQTIQTIDFLPKKLVCVVWKMKIEVKSFIDLEE